jgi:prepilin-type N-terminal cleavage/methylation domain-containing protein
MSTRSIARQGFTLVELMIALIIAAIVGAALLRMMVGQARFMDQQEASRSARSVARSGINRLVSDLRAVEASGGLVAAAAGGQDFTLRVPYAFGIVCSHGLPAVGITTVSLLPVDSAMYSAPGFSGFAWRNAAGVYSYPLAVPVIVSPGTAANCQNAGPDSIHTLPAAGGSPAGRIINLTGVTILPAAPPRGSLIYLYRRVRYEFKASAAVPGQLGLWRTTVTGGATEELAAPFAATARVNFYVLNNAAPQAAVPAPLTNTRGLELVLNGLSERAPSGTTVAKSAPVTTSVFFENRPD